MDESTTEVAPQPAVAVSAPVDEVLIFERGDEAELAEKLQAVLGNETTFDLGSFHTYDDDRGVWRTRTKESVESIVSRFAGAVVLSPKPKELTITHRKVVGAVSIARARLVDTDCRKFSTAAPGVAFRNGFASVFDGAVILDPHHPVHMAQHAFEFDYDAGAPHPKLDEFFEQVFGDVSASERQQQISLFQEFIGTSLIGEATRYQRCLVLYGTGANGKSSILEIARCVFPPGSVASVPPQDWSKQFGIGSLIGVLANLVNEIPEHEIVANAVFKSVISGEHVQAERKFRDAFSFRPRAGHIFAANSLPATNDASHGFWRRLLVIPFTRDMERFAGHRSNVAEAIVGTERAAVVAWALEGAARVQRQRGYTQTSSSSRILVQWRRDADSVRYFLETECTIDMNKRLVARDLYKSYQTWALDNGFRPFSLVGFGRRASQAGYKATHTTAGNTYALRVKGPRRI